jgi:hypothetical protein
VNNKAKAITIGQALAQRGGDNPGPMTPEQARALHVENTRELFPPGTPVIRTAGRRTARAHAQGLFAVLESEGAGNE